MTDGSPTGLRPYHVALSVGDLEASIAWYRDVLGFELDRVVDVPEEGCQARSVS